MAEKVTGTLIEVIWPLSVEIQMSVVDSIKSVLTLVRKQFQDENIYVFSVFVGVKLLDGFSFFHEGRTVNMNYVSLMKETPNAIKIMFCKPATPAK